MIIQSNPEIPPGLREAALRGILIPFVGAGASTIAGCPNWRGFADGALQFFIEQGKFTHAQLAQISHLNPRVKLSLARSLEKQHGIQIDFKKILHPGGRTNINGRRLYESLSKLSKVFVTTNYDLWLDTDLGTTMLPSSDTAGMIPRELSRKVIDEIADLTAYNLDQPNTVIHLHGSLNKPDGMILTTQDYVNHYANDRSSKDENQVLTFLENLFRNKTVLFIGYGLEELEILEYVIVKARLKQNSDTKHQLRHYVLQGFFQHQQQLVDSMTTYFGDCGIQLIPFLRDYKDWEQLVDVVEDFARAAPAAEIMASEKLIEMGALLGNA